MQPYITVTLVTENKGHTGKTEEEVSFCLLNLSKIIDLATCMDYQA